MYLAARLDDIGKPAWIALLVASFIIWWPIGLATLAFLLGSGRMGCGHYGHLSWQERRERWRRARSEWRAMRCGDYGAMRTSGNTAFDDYRSEDLGPYRDGRDVYLGNVVEDYGVHVGVLSAIVRL